MSKIKTAALALLAMVVIVAMTSASIAYFTDSKTAKNTFTMGNVAITLDEAPVDNQGKAAAGSRVDHIDYGKEAAYPGAVLDKDPTVHNVGKNPAYIRAAVTVSSWAELIAACYPEFGANSTQAGYEAALRLLVGELGEGWSVVGMRGGDTFVLKYDAVLTPGADTTPIFRHVLVPGKLENGNAASFSEVNVLAEAVQQNGFDSWENAFTAFDNN